MRGCVISLIVSSTILRKCVYFLSCSKLMRNCEMLVSSRMRNCEMRNAQECEIAKCSLAFKRINNEVPQYISERLTLNSERHSRTTRYCNLNFICPRFKRKTEGGSTFSVTTTTLWNSLPITIRQSSSAMALRNSLRKRFLAGQKFLRHFCP